MGCSSSVGTDRSLIGAGRPGDDLVGHGHSPFPRATVSGHGTARSLRSRARRGAAGPSGPVISITEQFPFFDLEAEHIINVSESESEVIQKAFREIIGE